MEWSCYKNENLNQDLLSNLIFQTLSILVNGKFIVSKPFVHSKFDKFIQQNTNFSSSFLFEHENKVLKIGFCNNSETDQQDLDSATDLTNEKLKAMRKSLRSRSVCSSSSAQG